MRLNGSWSEAELDAFGAELPMVALDSLRFDLDHARHEAAAGSHAKAEAHPVPPANKPPANNCFLWRSNRTTDLRC